MLLEHGANLRKDRTFDGSTAVYAAARSGSFEVEESILKFERFLWKVLRLLLDASCPLTRAKLDERFK